jgi:hypothetical protein
VAELYDEELEVAEFGAAEILLSLPRPLMPLLEFLYSDAKYSQSSLSLSETYSPARIDANFEVRYRSVLA